MSNDKINMHYIMKTLYSEYRKYLKLPLLTNSETLKYIEQAQNGDQNAKIMLIRHNIKLIFKHALIKTSNNEQINDLMEVGIEGLLIAINKFDLQNHKNFSTYATYWIKDKIRKEKKKMINGPYIPYNDYEKARKRLVEFQKNKENNPNMTISFFIKTNKIKAREEQALIALYNNDNLQDIEENVTIQKMIDITDSEQDINIYNIEKKQIFILLETVLEERELLILKLKLGYYGNCMTSFEIAKYLEDVHHEKISYQRVNQLINNSYRKIILSELLNVLAEYSNLPHIESIKKQRIKEAISYKYYNIPKKKRD